MQLLLIVQNLQWDKMDDYRIEMANYYLKFDSLANNGRVMDVDLSSDNYSLQALSNLEIKELTNYIAIIDELFFIYDVKKPPVLTTQNEVLC